VLKFSHHSPHTAIDHDRLLSVVILSATIRTKQCVEVSYFTSHCTICPPQFMITLSQPPLTLQVYRYLFWRYCTAQEWLGVKWQAAGVGTSGQYRQPEERLRISYRGVSRLHCYRCCHNAGGRIKMRLSCSYSQRAQQTFSYNIPIRFALF
jgi:hypothetical protein